MGYATTASGIFSTAMGGGTIASGTYSTAMGEETTASGDGSTAMGEETTASGDRSTAMGEETTASGLNSTAMGYRTTASGVESTAMGYLTTAKSYAELAIGLNNTDYTPASTNSWQSGDRLFVIGNGTSVFAKSDAMIVYKNGNTIINGALTLSNGSDSITLPNTDGTSGQVLATDGAGNISWSSVSSGSSLWTQGTGSTIYTTDNVGIGTSSGAYSLNVSGDASFQNGRILLGGNNLTSPGTAMTMFLNGTSGGTGAGNQSYLTLQNNHSLRIQDASNNSLVYLHAGGIIALDASNTANVAIGGLTATEKLDVNGKIRMRTGATAGYVPVADADGVMTWTDPSTLSIGNSGTDDQNISGSGLSGTALTIGIEGGSSETIDLASLQDGTGALEEITEGGNTGYRIAGRDAANYGDIGNYAVDLSYSSVNSTTKGASGNYSTAMGIGTTASGNISTAMGDGTTASGSGSTAMGLFLSLIHI